ncbi:MAG: tetratricopeptide repeat protein [Candidatus Anammoxibacter sp.]
MAEKDAKAGGGTEDINEETPEVAGNDSSTNDPIGEKGEESSVWSGTEELATKSAPKETEETGKVEKIADTAENISAKEVAKEEAPAAEDAKAEDVASPEPKAEEKPDVALKPAIFTKLLSPLLKIGFVAKFAPVEKIENIAKKIDSHIPGINLSSIKGKASPANIIGFIKDKVSSIKDRDIIGVLKNPWVIANGVILVVALSMTVIIVLWFKTSANKINIALTDFAQRQYEPRKDEAGVGTGKHEETLVKETLDVNEEFESFLESAEQWFRRKEYQEALAFYKALVSVESEIEDESFLDLRIGECYFHLGLYNKAVEAFDNVLFANDGSKENKWRSQYLIAECYMKVGDYDKGRRTLYTLIAMGGDFPSVITDLVERSYFRIANSYLEEAQVRLAVKD